MRFIIVKDGRAKVGSPVCGHGSFNDEDDEEMPQLFKLAEEA